MIRPPAELTTNELSFLGVGIRRVTPTQHHVVFVYQAPDNTLRLSHVEWHRRFKGAEAWNSQYYWCTAAGMDELNRKFVAAWLYALAQKPQQMDYGLDFEDCEFVTDEAGAHSFIAKTAGKGVTCATYIMLVLQQVGWPLINAEGWPQRPEDTQWQQSILQALKEHSSMTDEQIALVAKDVGCIRFRPIEIAAAADHDSWPVVFTTASQLAANVAAQVAELRLQTAA